MYPLNLGGSSPFVPFLFQTGEGGDEHAGVYRGVVRYLFDFIKNLKFGDLKPTRGLDTRKGPIPTGGTLDTSLRGLEWLTETN